MAGVDVNTLTMEQYLALSRENQAPGVVKPEIGGNVNFEIKSQFMRELREDTFSENKDEDDHDHIDRVLSIVGLFNIPGVSKDAIMLRVFPFTLTGAAKRWVDRLAPGTINTWDLLKKAFIQSHQKGPIPGMRPAEALTAIQTMADHSQKWHDGTTSRNIGSSSSKDGLVALVNKLDNLGRDMKKLKESDHAIQVGCQICEGPHLDKDFPLNKEVKQVEEETSMLNTLYGVSFTSDPESDATEVLQHQLPRKELNPGNFTLPCTIGKFNFYAMADLGASINVMPRSIFEHLHLTNLRKTNMLCEMADMSKKAPLGIVENVLVKIGKFLFLSDFVIIDNTPSETTILGRPFLATIRAEIDVFAGKISLGINKDRISFDSMRNSHKYTNPSERISMVRPQSPAQSNNQIDYKESGNWDNTSPNLDDREPKKHKLELDKNVPRAHFCSLIKQNIKEQTNMWSSCDPDKKICDGRVEICGVSKTGNLRFLYYNYDNERRNIKGKGLSFPDFLLAKYGKIQIDTLVWDSRYVEWCDISPSSEASSQEPTKPRPKDYTFREWTLIKVGHTDIIEPVKKALLKIRLINCFQDNSACENNLTHKSFDDYKWEFNLEIDKLVDEYKLGIGKKGHNLDHIWEYCNQVHNKNYEWHNYEFKNEECEEIRIEEKDYHPPEVHVETFEVKKYSFEKQSHCYKINELGQMGELEYDVLKLCDEYEGLWRLDKHGGRFWKGFEAAARIKPQGDDVA
ncbi:putative reverse transcriptase domain-containing protein [Tanacetum coccineum]